MTTLILLAGGIGKRANLKVPKQYYRINSKRIIEYTLENVSDVKNIDSIVLVSNPDFIKTAEILSESYPKINQIAPGGRTRNESIYNGFQKISFPENKVLIHDAVRPFTPAWVFEKIIKKLDKLDVITTANPITGNLIELSNGKVVKIHNRNRYVIGEAPTGYRYEVLKTTLQKAIEGKYLNIIPHDILLAIKAGFDIHVLHCNCFNLKITFKEDINIAKCLLK